MRYEIAKEMYPKAIDNAMMVLRGGGRAVVEDGMKTLTFDTMPKYAAYLAVSYADALIDELEKQGEQKPSIRERYDKIKDSEWFKKTHEGMSVSEENIDPKPKFKVGDWIISNNKQSTYQVIEVKRGIYVIRDNADNHEYHIGIEECEKSGRLWNISDAKPGDVLQLGIVTAIFRKYIGNEHCKCYCSVCNGEFEIPSQEGEDSRYGCFSATPATKEQHDLLFDKMHEAGYEWEEGKARGI